MNKISLGKSQKSNEQYIQWTERYNCLDLLQSLSKGISNLNILLQNIDDHQLKQIGDNKKLQDDIEMLLKNLQKILKTNNQNQEQNQKFIPSLQITQVGSGHQNNSNQITPRSNHKIKIISQSPQEIAPPIGEQKPSEVYYINQSIQNQVCNDKQNWFPNNQTQKSNYNKEQPKAQPVSLILSKTTLQDNQRIQSAVQICSFEYCSSKNKQIYHENSLFLSCSHSYHKQCLLQMIAQQLEQKQYNIICNQIACKKMIKLRQIKSIIYREEYEKFQNKLSENQLNLIKSCNQNIVKCPALNCSFLMFHDKKRSPTCKCIQCLSQICLKCMKMCKESSHKC